MKYAQLSLVPTPDAWLERASEQVAVLLTDHANCEKKSGLYRLEFDVPIR